MLGDLFVTKAHFALTVSRQFFHWQEDYLRALCSWMKSIAYSAPGAARAQVARRRTGRY